MSLLAVLLTTTRWQQRTSSDANSNLIANFKETKGTEDTMMAKCNLGGKRLKESYTTFRKLPGQDGFVISADGQASN